MILTQKQFLRFSKRAQSTLDYIFLITIVIAILLIMGYYIRNSLSGKMREGSDAIGRGEVYLPGRTTVESSVENQ